MKKLILSLLLLFTFLFLVSCNNTEEDVRFKMIATVEGVGDVLEVNVTEAEYASGRYWVIVGESTEIYSESGAPASLDSLRVGDRLEIYYNGQVMMSYPPQIVALKIKALP